MQLDSNRENLLENVRSYVLGKIRENITSLSSAELPRPARPPPPPPHTHTHTHTHPHESSKGLSERRHTQEVTQTHSFLKENKTREIISPGMRMYVKEVGALGKGMQILSFVRIHSIKKRFQQTGKQMLFYYNSRLWRETTFLGAAVKPPPDLTYHISTITFPITTTQWLPSTHLTPITLNSAF